MITLLLAACGGTWNPQSFEEIHGAFALDCGHEMGPDSDLACESCHDPSLPPGPVDASCISCHGNAEDRPASHEPANDPTGNKSTQECSECHSGCSFEEGASPHPGDFGEGDQHGPAFNLQQFAETDPSGGVCTDCHGAALDGVDGTAQGCDSCHELSGIGEWRTDCVLCHGGELEPSGAPPGDVDGLTPISFVSHTAHVDADGDYRASTCKDCHRDHQDILDPGHIFVEDWTPGVGEVDFADVPGPSGANTTYNNGTCGNLYCHGAGQYAEGTATDGDPELNCESCHSTDSGWNSMSGLHEAHLSEGGIVCNDCHAAVIDAAGNIATPERHVDGARDISFFETTISTTDGGGTCQGVCHGAPHDQTGWGHPPGYDAPELHGIDSNMQWSNCRSCHGNDWTGGVAQGCDTCHANEGHADWRTDCTFCHGGEVDHSGAPPQDIDDETDLALISFMAHPEHVGAGGLGHAFYDCNECHEVWSTATDAGHAVDGSAGISEVTLLAGLSNEGGWDNASFTCSNLYCHGDGRAPSGQVTDDGTPMTCDGCHATTTGWDTMSGTHDTHMSEGVTCSECHADVDASNNIDDPAQHVDGDIDIDNAAIGRNPTAGTCTIDCHNVDHNSFGWLGPHPAGYDAPEMHGAEALYWVQDCTSCHGNDLLGGSSGSSCSNGGCHPADWRTNCTWCHGDTDPSGIPPTDVDGEANEDLISFKAHPEHADGDEHPLWGCEVCHGAASATYSDALTDPGHWVDTTAGAAEVSFTGLAAGTVYAANNCSNNQCHGDGQTNGSQTDGTQALTCNGCHAYDQFVSDLSGTHATHLGVSGVTCADCHSPVVDAAGNITQPNSHVNGTVNFDTVATGYDAGSATCTVNCHNENHTGWGWNGGHPPGYDAPEIHGQEALFIDQDCKSCHGSDLLGGSSGQGCDTCHTSGWKSDCAYCHGTTSDGLPPQDLDNTTNESQITFMAHPEHSDGDTHPLWGCEECHGSASAGYSNALTDANHWFDSSPGVAEVSFTDLAAGATYSNGTCSNLYCHGDGRSDGSETDSDASLSCTGCHGMPPNSGEHRDHDHDRYDCTECHALTVNSSEVIIGADIHVDGNVDVDMNSALNSVSWTGSRCSGSCHGEGHSSESW